MTYVYVVLTTQNQILGVYRNWVDAVAAQNGFDGLCRISTEPVIQPVIGG